MSLESPSIELYPPGLRLTPNLQDAAAPMDSGELTKLSLDRARPGLSGTGWLAAFLSYLSERRISLRSPVIWERKKERWSFRIARLWRST